MTKPTGNAKGRPAIYRGKNRNKALCLALTDRAREHLEQEALNKGISRQDYIEALVRGDIEQTVMTDKGES